MSANEKDFFHYFGEMRRVDLPFTSDVYTNRRKSLCTLLGHGKILLLGNDRSPINFKDNGYHFRQDSTFLYYIGIPLPGLNAILDTETQETILFGDDVDLDDIIWMGAQQPLTELAEAAGITNVLASNALSKHLEGRIHYLPPYRAEHTEKLKSYLDLKNIKSSIALLKAIISQRNTKSAGEIKELEKAVKLSNAMHLRVIQATKAGLHEYDLVAEASKFCWQNNVQWAYHPILTTQGQVLHNHYHHRQLNDGDLLLYDGGIELASGYCGDITRTFPVSKRFSGVQRDLYKIVHAAYLTGIDNALDGSRFIDVHLAVAKTIIEGLKAIGWMKGDTDEAVKAGAHTLFFQHGLGHMIGLDVHDMENLGEEYVGYDDDQEKSTKFGLKSLRMARKMKPGHCFTIEPGIYIIPDLIDKFEAKGLYRDFVNYNVINKNRDAGGIRIEDNLVITENGNRVMDGSLPTEIQVIEALRQEFLA